MGDNGKPKASALHPPASAGALRCPPGGGPELVGEKLSRCPAGHRYRGHVGLQKPRRWDPQPAAPQLQAAAAAARGRKERACSW